MKKVLMIFEDFQDSGQTQTDLKKVGFDVLAMNTTARLSDTILTFRPDVVVGCGFQKMPSLQIGQELKKLKHFRGKCVLILPHGERPLPTELTKARVDVLVEAPVQPKRLIEILAKLMEMDPAHLLEKFSKAKIQEHAPPPATRAHTDTGAQESDMVRVRGTQPDAGAQRVRGFQEEEIHQNVKGGGAGPSSSTAVSGEKDFSQMNDQERIAGYKKFIENMNIDTHSTSHTKAAIKARQEQLKKGWDFNMLDALDALKRQFAEALFKKSN